MPPNDEDRADVPTRPDAIERRWWDGASWRLACIATGFGVVADLWVRAPFGLGLSAAIVLSVAIFVLVVKPSVVSVAFLGAGVSVGGFIALRDNPTLTLLNVGTAALLLALGAGSATRGATIPRGARALATRLAVVAAAVPRGCAMVVGPPARTIAMSPEGLRVVPRRALITIPVLAVFVTLLASADAVFAHYLSAPFSLLPNIGAFPPHLFAVGSGALVLSTLLSGATDIEHDAPGPLRVRSWLRRADWVLLLGMVDVLFAGFVLVQFSYLFGGQTQVLADRGLTVAEYARTGFAQLLAAVLLTGALITVVWFVGEKDGRSHGRTFAILTGILIVLSLIVLASAFRRLVAYEGAFGWTWPRLEVHLTIVFLAALLGCSLVAVTLRRGGWLPAAAILIGVLMLLGLNLMDPDRFIAERNIARFHATGLIDTDELAHMSADATPVILAEIPTLRQADRSALTSALGCQAQWLRGHAGSFASWNLGRAAALEALHRATVETCP